MNKLNSVAKTNVIEIVKAATVRYANNGFEMMLHLEEVARDHVTCASQLTDKALKKLHLTVARELVRVRERLLETMLSL